MIKRLLKSSWEFARNTFFVFSLLGTISTIFYFGNMEFLVGCLGIAMFVGFISAFYK